MEHQYVFCGAVFSCVTFASFRYPRQFSLAVICLIYLQSFFLLQIIADQVNLGLIFSWILGSLTLIWKNSNLLTATTMETLTCQQMKLVIDRNVKPPTRRWIEYVKNSVPFVNFLLPAFFNAQTWNTINWSQQATMIINTFIPLLLVDLNDFSGTSHVAYDEFEYVFKGCKYDYSQVKLFLAKCYDIEGPGQMLWRRENEEFVYFYDFDVIYKGKIQIRDQIITFFFRFLRTDLRWVLNTANMDTSFLLEAEIRNIIQQGNQPEPQIESNQDKSVQPLKRHLKAIEYLFWNPNHIQDPYKHEMWLRRIIDTVLLEHTIHNHTVIQQIQSEINKFTDPIARKKMIYSRGKCSLCLVFHGVPGTGKSTLARNISATLNRSSVTADKSVSINENIKRFLTLQPQKHVFIFDDADFWNMKNRLEITASGVKSNENLNRLMEWLDGAEMGDDSVIIFTTNHLQNFDEALFRSGRVNKVISVGPITDAWDKIFNVFYPEECNTWREAFSEMELKFLYGENFTLAEIVQQSFSADFVTFVDVMKTMIKHKMQ